MTKIVCDTMIWYKLGSGDIDAKVIKSNSLVLTGETLWELATTHHLTENYALFSNGCIAVKKYSKIRIFKNSFEYLLSRNTNSEFFKIYKSITQVAHAPNRYSNPPQGLLLEVNLIREERKELLKPFVDYFNETIASVQENIKNNTPLSKHRGLNLFNGRKQYITFLYEEYAKFFNIDDFDIPNWNRLELFINVLDCWFKKLETGELVKFAYNDWPDIQNMVYVKPNMKYWTHEKKWILMIWDSGMKEYLFVDDEVNRILKKFNRIH